jgi:hypothetical protein
LLQLLSNALDLGILSDPLTFAEAVGLASAIVLFLFYFFKVISKFG